MKCARTLCLLLLLAAVTLPGFAEELPVPPRKHTTIQRMTLPRLEAVHLDVQALQAARRDVQLKTGLKDYRAIIHTHASDSDHTGGTREEMLEDAIAVGVDIIMLTDHFRPPRDFIEESWRGMRDGVLFIPGSEAKGFLIFPVRSIMEQMDQETSAFIDTVTTDGGLIFLSHLEARPDHSTEGLTGVEIYNRHADALDDLPSMRWLFTAMVHPTLIGELEQAVERFPDAWLAAQQDYPSIYMSVWDRETQLRRQTGIAANDSHHNQVYLTKMVDEETVLVGTIVDADDAMTRLTAAQHPTIRALTQDRAPGDILARLDFDPYTVMFRNNATHILAPELSEEAVRTALQQGRAYVSHDWMCDPTGFVYGAVRGAQDPGAPLEILMGDEVGHAPDLRLLAEFPLDCTIRLIKNGALLETFQGHALQHVPDGPGVYRLEGWLTLDGEERPWIYSNPVYVR